MPMGKTLSKLVVFALDAKAVITQFIDDTQGELQ
jgi:hypothetical protein